MADTGRDMPAGNQRGKQEGERRHLYGPRPLGALMPPVVRAAFRKRSPASAQLIADWDAIIGPRLAADVAPRRLAMGTLTLACAGPVALELQHFAPALIERINTHLGQQAVQRLRFVQDVPSRPVAPALAAIADTGAADHAVAGLPEGPLRDALLALGRAVLSRRS